MDAEGCDVAELECGGRLVLVPSSFSFESGRGGGRVMGGEMWSEGGGGEMCSEGRGGD